MSNIQAVIIGAALIIGLTIHGALSGEDPTPGADAAMGHTLQRIESNRMRELKRIEEVRSKSTRTQALLETSRPRTLQIGDRTLIVDGDFRNDDDGFNMKTRYYEYQDGVLQQVPLKLTADDK